MNGFSLVWTVKPIFNYIFPIIKENINAYFDTHHELFEIPLKIKPLPQKKVSELLSGTKEIKVVQDMTLKVDKTLGPVAIKIDKNGIDVIAEMISTRSVTTRQRVENIPRVRKGRLIKNEFRVLAYHTNHRRLSISKNAKLQKTFYNSSLYSASYSTTDVLRFDIPSVSLAADVSGTQLRRSGTGLFSSRRREARQNRRSEIPTRSDFLTFEEIYASYRSLFDSLSLSAFDSLKSIDTTEFSVSKYFVALLINEVFSSPTLKLQYPYSFSERKDPESIKLHDKPVFSCSRVLIDCSNQLEDCGRKLRDCGWNCKWYNVLCKAGKLACYAENGVIWSVCQVGNGVRYAACQTGNGARYLWCSTVFLVDYLLYEALYLGDYAVEARGNLLATIQLKQISVSENLSSFSILNNTSASGSYDARFWFAPHGLSWLVCTFGLNCPVSDSFTVELPTNIKSTLQAIEVPKWARFFENKTAGGTHTCPNTTFNF